MAFMPAGLTIFVLYVWATSSAPAMAQTVPAGCPTALSPFGTTFERVAIGNPLLREIDANGDGTLCGIIIHDRQGDTLILDDNRNQLRTVMRG